MGEKQPTATDFLPQCSQKLAIKRGKVWLQEPVFRRAIHALNLPPGSRGIDVGCGIGLQAIMLAEVVGVAGHVTGVDLSHKFLDCARSIAEKAGSSEQVSFQEGGMNNRPFDDDAFDWVWSANCAGYTPR